MAMLNLYPRNLSKIKIKKKKYTIIYRYPHFSASQTSFRINSIITKHVQIQIKTFIQNVVSENNVPSGLPNSSLYVNYKVYYHKHGCYSVAFFSESFFRGAAHPSHFITPINYNVVLSKDIELEDLFKPTANYLQQLSIYSRFELIKQRKQKKQKNIQFDQQWFVAGTAPLKKNYIYWNYTDSSLIIHFPEYSIAAYVYGAFHVDIPFEKLNGFSFECIKGKD